MVKVKMNNGMEAEMSVEEFKELITLAHNKIEEMNEVIPKQQEQTTQRISRLVRLVKGIKGRTLSAPMKNKPWSKADEKILEQMFENKDNPKKIAKALGRTVDGIRQRCKISGLRRFTKVRQHRSIKPNDGRIKMMQYVNADFKRLRGIYPTADTKYLRKVAFQNYSIEKTRGK